MTSARNRANPKLDLSTERRDALSVKTHPAAGGRGWEFDPAFQWLMWLEEVNYHTLGSFRVEKRQSWMSYSRSCWAC